MRPRVVPATAGGVISRKPRREAASLPDALGAEDGPPGLACRACHCSCVTAGLTAAPVSAREARRALPTNYCILTDRFSAFWTLAGSLAFPLSRLSWAGLAAMIVTPG